MKALVMFIMSFEVFAGCAASFPAKSIFVFASMETKMRGQGVANKPIVITGCDRAERGKYLMITTGVKHTSLTYRTESSSVGHFFKDKCVAKNIQGKQLDTYEEDLAKYKKLHKNLHMCLNTTVASRNKLRPAPKQEKCKVTMLNDKVARIQGGLCFFKIGHKDAFQIIHTINEKCLDENYLRENDIDLGDYLTKVGTYVAGDASGRSLELNPLKMGNLRMSLLPKEEQLPLSTDFGVKIPRWPVKLSMDVHMGNIEIFQGKGRRKRGFIKSSLIVDNRCERDCSKGSCVSACDYAIPVAAEKRISLLHSSGKEYVMDVWYESGIAYPQWKGFLGKGLKRTLGQTMFQPGKRYRLQVNLAYPNAFYELAKQGFKQLLIKSTKKPSAGDGVLGDLTPLPTLGGNSNRLPSIGGLGGLTGTVRTGVQSRLILDNTALDGYLNALNSIIGIEGWPGHYTDVCNPVQSLCRPLYPEGLGLKIITDFTVDKITPRGAIILKDLVVKRKSRLHEEYVQNPAVLPEVSCK